MSKLENNMETIFVLSPNIKDKIYKLYCEEKSLPIINGREFVDSLWKKYQPYADSNFLEQITQDFYSRFWEMYLTCAFLEHNFKVKSDNKGPDICLPLSGKKIWIEAIAPTAGKQGLDDTVPEREMGDTSVPDEKIIMRYSGAIKEKFENRYLNYLRQEIVLKDAPYIIAINGSKIPFSRNEISLPRIVRTVFPVGQLEIVVNTKTLDFGDPRYQFKDVINKSSQSLIYTNIFLDQKYEYLSAVLYSSTDPLNRPDKIGNDFVLVHNPLAKNPINKGMFKFGKEYSAKLEDTSFQLSWQSWI